MTTATIIPSRNIGGIIPQVVVEESHHDEMVITDHPVEQGASISDHAYSRPAELRLKYGWANSGQSDPQFINSVYNQLLTLKEKRIPFSVLTTKRSYDNMLISSLSVTTDERTAATLMVRASCRQVIIVQTQATAVPSRAVHAMPERTAPVTNAGTQQLGPAPVFNGN